MLLEFFGTSCRVLVKNEVFNRLWDTVTMQHFVVRRDLNLIQCVLIQKRHTHTHTHIHKQTHTSSFWWSWSVQMASGLLYIIQACLHGMSGGSLSCQDYFAHSQKQWRNCGLLCMLPAKCCFQNQLKGGSCCFFLFLFFAHIQFCLFHSQTVFLISSTLSLLHASQRAHGSRMELDNIFVMLYLLQSSDHCS